jgi:hypothetical protein
MDEAAAPDGPALVQACSREGMDRPTP